MEFDAFADKSVVASKVERERGEAEIGSCTMVRLIKEEIDRIKAKHAKTDGEG